MSQFETLAVINIRDGAVVYKIADIAIKDGFLPGRIICFGVQLDYAERIVECGKSKRGAEPVAD